MKNFNLVCFALLGLYSFVMVFVSMFTGSDPMLYAALNLACLANVRLELKE